MKGILKEKKDRTDSAKKQTSESEALPSTVGFGFKTREAVVHYGNARHVTFNSSNEYCL